MMSEQPVKLIPTRPDAEIARDLIERTKTIMEQLIPIAKEAQAAGLLIHFGLKNDPIGRTVPDVYATKRFD